MNHLQKQRLQLLFAALLGLALAAGLLIYAFRDDMNAYFTPTDLKQHRPPINQTLTLGGVVATHSLKQRGLDHDFIITDFKNQMAVHYHGLLPDLFREGKGVMATGTLTSANTFEASRILAKHDETYTPAEVQS